MKKIATAFMRIALLALVFQTVCPLFLSVIAGNNEFQSHGKVTLHAQDHSVNAPTLLKEKDESETEDYEFVVKFIALIDFSDLSSILSQSHNSKIVPFKSLNRIDYRPPLFTLHGVFLI